MKTMPLNEEDIATTIIGSSTRIKGKFWGEENFIIEGNIDGVIENKMNIVIGEAAHLRTDSIKAKNVTVRGKINGFVEAEEKIEIMPSGEIIGDIRSKVVSIVSGARFVGNCESNFKSGNNPEKNKLERAEPVKKFKKHTLAL